MLTRAIQILKRHQESTGLFDKVVRGLYAYGSPQMQTLADARLIAIEAHRYDRRHTGEAYIRHPELVMVIDMEYLGCTNTTELAGCLIHDVPEDHEDQWPIYRIREKIGKEIAESADWVNRRRFDYIEDSREADRAFFNNLLNVAPLHAVRIKLCDQLHNGLTPWNLDNRSWVHQKIYDLREYYIPMAKKYGILYQELIAVANALENGTCLLPSLSSPVSEAKNEG